MMRGDTMKQSAGHRYMLAKPNFLKFLFREIEHLHCGNILFSDIDVIKIARVGSSNTNWLIKP